MSKNINSICIIILRPADSNKISNIILLWNNTSLNIKVWFQFVFYVLCLYEIICNDTKRVFREYLIIFAIWISMIIFIFFICLMIRFLRNHIKIAKKYQLLLWDKNLSLIILVFNTLSIIHTSVWYFNHLYNDAKIYFLGNIILWTW